MAVVYRAHDEMLKREVAIKVLHPHLLAEPESKARLEREARAVAKLQHDNIVQIFDYSGGAESTSYIVTEFIDGLTLKQFLAKQTIPLPEVAAVIAAEVGHALAHAHSLGILHRDIKPDNVMVRKDGVLKLMDFGVAQIVDLERMTVTGQLLGSPAYMAPEVLEGKTLDFRTDVFSVGIMLYQLATGSLPFTGRNPHEVLKRIAEGCFADPRTLNRLIGDRLARIMSRAMAKNPLDRYRKIEDMVDDLRGYVGEAGLHDTTAEAKAFFTGPDVYGKELAPRVVRALVETGRREKAEQHLARALEVWNRALALDADNIDVLRELARLEGRRRLQRSAVFFGVAGLMAVLVWGAFQLAQTDTPVVADTSVRTPGARKVASPEPVRQPPVAALQAVEPTKRTAPQMPAAGRPKPVSNPATPVANLRVAAGPIAVAKPVIEKVQFTLGPRPPNVDIFVDGKFWGEYGPDKKTLALEWDRTHTVEFRNDRCCLRKSIDVGPDTFRPPDDHLIAKLDLKMGNVTVKVEPASGSAKIMLSEVGKERPWQTTARAGERVPVPFDASDEIRKSLQVMVLAGDKPVIETIEVTAGQPTKHTVQLDK